MISKTMEESYNRWHDKLNEDANTFKTLTDPWYQTVMRLLPSLENKRVLEIGAGRGEFTIWMGQHFPNAKIIGTDFSKSAIHIAGERLKKLDLPNVSFKVENAESLSFEENAFDIIISCETIEHVLSPQLMANEICRVLDNNGVFIITTENYFNGMILLWLKTWITGRPFESGCGLQPHENFFTFIHLRRIFKRAGLKLTHTESNHFQFLLLPCTDPAKLCVTTFKKSWLNRFFKPFGRHYTYVGKKQG